MTKDFLTVKEASQMLGLSKGTLYNMIGRNQIPYYQPRGKVYFKRAEILQWIEEGRVASVEEVRNEIKRKGNDTIV